jgi:hypothetical protein
MKIAAVKLDDYERALEQRVRAAGFEPGTAFVARNDGSRRTAEKRALLSALADGARAAGNEPTFKAKF